MATPEPVWNRALQRFQNQVMNMQIMPTNLAVRWLKISSGMLRDVRGRRVPDKFLGGDILRIWPTGSVNYTALTRGIPVDIEEAVVRPFEHLTAQVSYTVEGEYRSPVGVTLPSGRSYAEPLADERISRRFIVAEGYSSERVEFIEDIEILDIQWSMTTFYKYGRTWGGEYEYWEG